MSSGYLIKQAELELGRCQRTEDIERQQQHLYKVISLCESAQKELEKSREKQLEERKKEDLQRQWAGTND